MVHPSLIHEDGTRFFPSDKIVVKLKQNYQNSATFTLLSKLCLKLLNQNEYNSNIWHLKIQDWSCGNLSEIIDLLEDTAFFEWVEVDFWRSYPKQNIASPLNEPIDPYFEAQWPLNNSGDVPNYIPFPNVLFKEDADMDVLEAWELTKGSPDIIVAVIDDGVELSHPDLADNLVPGRSFGDDFDGENGMHGGGSHGTGVAGLIAAIENDEYVVGVAPRCRIMPIRVPLGEEEFGLDSDYGNAIRHAYIRGADIINNSWGGGPSSDIINDAIKDAVEEGRDGKRNFSGFLSWQR